MPLQGIQREAAVHPQSANESFQVAACEGWTLFLVVRPINYHSNKVCDAHFACRLRHRKSHVMRLCTTSARNRKAEV